MALVAVFDEKWANLGFEKLQILRAEFSGSALREYAYRRWHRDQQECGSSREMFREHREQTRGRILGGRSVTRRDDEGRHSQTKTDPNAALISAEREIIDLGHKKSRRSGILGG